MIAMKSPARTTAIAVVLGLVSAGCSFGSGSDDPAPTPTPTSASSDVDGSQGTGSLLSVDDIIALEGAPPDLQEAETEHRRSKNLDLYGPCGARIDGTTDGEDRVMLVAEGYVIVESLYSMNPASAQEIVNSVRADIEPDCPFFAAETPTSTVENNRFLREVDLPAEAGDAVATVSVVQGQNSLPRTVGRAIFEEGGRLVVITLTSGSDIFDPLLADLTVAARAKL